MNGINIFICCHGAKRDKWNGCCSRVLLSPQFILTASNWQLVQRVYVRQLESANYCGGGKTFRISLVPVKVPSRQTWRLGTFTGLFLFCDCLLWDSNRRDCALFHIQSPGEFHLPLNKVFVILGLFEVTPYSMLPASLSWAGVSHETVPFFA